MARKKNGRAVPEDSRTTAEYYKLHTQAVRDLAEADESNSPEVSQEELDKYRSGPKIRLRSWAKAILIKIWFAGSVCFFIFWGLSSYVADRLDLLLIFGIVLGIVTDLLTNNILRTCAETPGANDRWMMFPEKRYITFPLNILYAILLLLCTDFLYTLINLAIAGVTGGAGGYTLGVGPILFGVFYTAFDLLFISIKRMLQEIIADAKTYAKRRD